MSRDQSSGSTVAVAIIVVISFAAVLTAYGWYSALNLLIPLAIAALWIGVVALAAWGLGEPVSRWALGPRTDTLEGLFLALMIGLGGLMATAAALAVFHVLTPVLVLCALACWASVGALRGYRSMSSVRTVAAIAIQPLWILIVAAGGISLAAATTFAPFYDQWHYHLAFPYQWLRAGTLITFERHSYSFFPANMGLLYVYALAGAGGWAAQVVHWSMGALSATGAATLAGRLGAPASGRLLAAAVFLCTPSAIQMSALAGSDLGVAAFGIAATLLVISGPHSSGHPTGRILTAGALTGVAVGCKYLALATVAVPLAVVVCALAAAATSAGRLRRAMTAALLFGLGICLSVGPWFVRNAIRTGNPTHPYFATWFQDSSTDDPDQERLTEGIGDFGLDADSAVAGLTLGTFKHRGHSADPGPVYLGLGPLLLIWIWRYRRRKEVLAVAAIAAGGALLWAIGPPLGRYLLPTLALVAACVGASWFDFLGGGPRWLRGLLTGLLAAVLVANCNPTKGEYLPEQISCFAGSADPDAYLEANCTQLEALQAAKDVLPTDAVVLMVGEPRSYGMDRNCVIEDQFRTPLLVELADSAPTAAIIASQLRTLGVTHLLWNDAEAQRIAAAEERSRYLSCATPQGDARLRRFFDEFTRPVARGGWWEISELEAP